VAEVEPWGQPVLDVRLNCDAQLTLADFPGVVTQGVGQPLDASKIAASLKELYATGLFTELRAEAEPGQGGVHLLFVGRAQYFIGVVQVEGTPSALEPRVLLTSSRLRLGQPVSDDDLVAAQRHISEVLASNGYHRAILKYRLLPDPATQEAEVLFSVFAGRPARLSSLEFREHVGFPPAKLAKVAGWHSGIQLTSARVERGLLRLHQFFVSHDRLQATVSVLKREYDTKLNTEKLLVGVETGPLVRVRVEGARISRSKLKELLPVYRDGVVDELALAHSDEILEDHFQQRGFFSATVKAEQAFHAESQTLDLTFRVNRGKPGQFMGYGFEGNRAIPTTELMAAIPPPARGIFSPPPLYSRTLMENKVNTLTALYQSKGFLETRISPRVDDHFQNQAAHWFVTFQVEEGLQTTVHQLALKGVSGDTQKALWPSLLTKPSQPYSPGRAVADRDTLANYLADRGYSQARVTWHASPVNEQHQVDLEFLIEPGKQERIQRIVVLGNEHTRLGVIRRELLICQGQALNQDTVADSQRRLYGLGLFNQVQVATQDQTSSETEKTVLVAVEESRRWVLGYGGGLEVQRLGSSNPQGTFKASPRISLDLHRLDVGGHAQTFTLWGRLSNLETGAGTSYVIPYLANRRDLSLRISGLIDRSRDVLTFTDDRKTASVAIEKRFSASTVVSGRYSFSRVEALDISNRISPLEKPLLSPPVHVGGFGASYVNDRRDDPADATRGSYSLADAGIAYKGFGSQANFVRFTGENATYYRLGEHLIFARNTRFGFESPYGSLEKLLVQPASGPKYYIFTDVLPLPERFFMGGGESHRGFSTNQAGPRDPGTGYPIGGNALFFNSFELRVPLAQRRLGLVVFNDSGNVFTTIRHMRLLKFSQSSLTDTDYDSDAVGLGIRYRTPVGPIRIDVGYNLNPTRYQKGVEVLQLSRFNYFLSIGQSF
jgi:outer membrane protein assembly complex protein YaeT